MGKSKKGNSEERGTKFSLLYRGTRDSAYAGEETPSEFVIVPAKLNIWLIIYENYTINIIRTTIHILNIQLN